MRQHARQPDLDGLRVTNEQGIISYGVGVKGAGTSLADRDYFITLRNEPYAGLVISKPLIGRTSGKRVIVLARRLNLPNGAFAGVAYATISLQHLSRTFSSLDLGQNGLVVLFDSSLNILARHPELKVTPAKIPAEGGSEQIRSMIEAGKTEGTFMSTSPLDDTPRVLTFRKVNDVRLNVLVGLASYDFLNAWRNEAAKTLGLVVFFGLVTLLLSWLVYRTCKEQELAVAALKEANHTLGFEKELNQTVIQSSPLAIYVRDRNNHVTVWNDAAAQMYGWSREEVLGKPLLIVPDEGRPQSDNLRKRVLSGEKIVQAELRRQRRDGTLLEISSTMAPLHDSEGKIYGYLAIVADITERKAAEQRIEFLAHHDALTRLPNRMLVQDRFRQAIASAERNGSKVAIVFLDLDNFKSINDTLGHSIGDALLQEIASRLNECVRNTDTISRQGGDEFLIVLRDLPDIEATAPIIGKIKEQLQGPFCIDGNDLATSVSIGVAVYPQDGEDFDTLLKRADMAMYQAKEAGRNTYRFFDEQMNIEAVDNLSMRNGLRRAIERGEFVLHYQPQIDLAGGAIVGAEALVRWRHPEKGLIYPDRFIHIAEESGLIVPIGEWVMREACRQAVEWKNSGLPDMVIGVNLSAVQFKRGDVEYAVLDALEKSGLAPEFLELELTESILIQNAESVLATVKRLKLLGIKLSIDDFGTGYSSLSYLKRFDVDKLKIDRSFIRDLATDPDDAAIVRAIIQMARSLNLRTIAEGVENEEMLAHLRFFHCDEAQGYHFARPMAAADFAAYVMHHSPQALAT